MLIIIIIIIITSIILIIITIRSLKKREKGSGGESRRWGGEKFLYIYYQTLTVSINFPAVPPCALLFPFTRCSCFLLSSASLCSPRQPSTSCRSPHTTHATVAVVAPPAFSAPSIRSSHRQPWGRASFLCLWPLSVWRLCLPPVAVTAMAGLSLAVVRRRPVRSQQPQSSLSFLQLEDWLKSGRWRLKFSLNGFYPFDC